MIIFVLKIIDPRLLAKYRGIIEKKSLSDKNTFTDKILKFLNEVRNDKS